MHVPSELVVYPNTRNTCIVGVKVFDVDVVYRCPEAVLGSLPAALPAHSIRSAEVVPQRACQQHVP
jgi:hypothetical protein